MTSFRGTDVRTTLGEIAEPSRSALLVYDALRHNVERQVDAAELVDRWQSLIEAARAAGVLVAYTRHVPLRAGASGAWIRYRMRLAGVDDPEELPELRSGPAAYEIVAALAPHDGDLVIDKRLNSAFHETDLEAWLRRRGLDAIVITGIATESGVETTCREALLRGFYPIVVSDAVSSTDPERHRAALGSMSRSAEIVDVAQLRALWARA